MVRKFISAKMPEGGFDIFLIDRKVIDVLKLLDEKILQSRYKYYGQDFKQT